MVRAHSDGWSGEAAAADNSKDLADAVGDMAIYLCDYCGRSRLALGDLVLDGAVPGLGVDKPLVPTDDGNLDPFAGVVAYVGALCHVELKRCQNIRGYHDDTFYRAQRVAALYGLVYYLQRFSKDNLGVGVYDVLKQTWENVVSKRNWREAQQAEKTAATE